MKTIYANALLSDEKILFWYTGQSPCLDWREFYKDFYYAGINATEYEKQHTLRIARMGFEDNTENEDYNRLIFDILAKDFYRQFAISEDSKGEKPYQPTADVVPKSEVEELRAVIADHKASEERWEELYANAKTEVAREIFEEIEKILPCDCKFNSQDIRMGFNWAITEIRHKIFELKKKYYDKE